MAFNNLHQFIDRLRQMGELKTISAEVDPVLEITEIYDRVVKSNGPALLFEKVRGAEIPLVINLFGSFARIHAALGVNRLDEAADRISSLIHMKPPAGFIDKLKLLPQLHSVSHMAPRLVRNAPCQEVVITQGRMLDKLPIIQCWPEDAGRYITFPIVITKNPENGARNLGAYRMQVFDNQTTAMHWQTHKDGTGHFHMFRKKNGPGRFEAAVALGADPITMYSATAPLPPDRDELLLAGFLRDRPVDIVKCRTVDLEVPAESEIVLEGYVDTEERRREGPFGDHTGFYSLAKEFPVFHITCMTHRRNAIYPTTVVGRPPMEDCYLGKASERIFLPLIRAIVPEIVDICMPWEGVFHNCVLVSIKKRYPHHARKVVSALWGLGQMMFAKCVVVFDEDANIQDVREAAWRAFNNIDPRRDIFFTEGPVDELDHSAADHLFGSKMGIDATRKLSEEGMRREWPGDIVMTKEVKERVTARWKEYGLDNGTLKS